MPLAWWFQLERASMPTRCRVVDFETFCDDDEYNLKSLPVVSYVRHPKFKVLGFAQAAFNQDTDSPSYFHTDDADAFIARAKDSWESGEEIVVAYNLRFDATILALRYGCRPKFIVDALGLARLRYPRMPNSLADVAPRLGLGNKLEMPTDSDLEAMAVYSRKDAELTRSITKILLPQIPNPKTELRLCQHTVELYTSPKLCLDVSAAKAMREEMQAEVVAAEATL